MQKSLEVFSARVSGRVVTLGDLVPHTLAQLRTAGRSMLWAVGYLRNQNGSPDHAFGEIRVRESFALAWLRVSRGLRVMRSRAIASLRAKCRRVSRLRRHHGQQARRGFACRRCLPEPDLFGTGRVILSLSSETPRRRSALVFLDAPGKFWALPYTCMGVMIGVPFLQTGSRCKIAHNAIVFHKFLSPYTDLNRAVMTYECAARAERRLPLPEVRTMHLGKHEEAHTRQYQVLGPLFLPVYLVTLLLPSPTPFERAADRYAHSVEGWWPWHVAASCRRRR